VREVHFWGHRASKLEPRLKTPSVCPHLITPPSCFWQEGIHNKEMGPPRAEAEKAKMAEDDGPRRGFPQSSHGKRKET
jgi:hypothetical protein